MKPTIFIVLALFLCPLLSFSQIKGVVTDEKNNSLPAVTVFVENSYNNTTTNEKGFYELNKIKKEKQTIVFQCLGFKTKKVVLDNFSLPYIIDVKLQEENYSLQEVVVSNKENPANLIMRNAIKSKKENSDKTAKYTSDFYSRGLLRIKDAPKKFLGQDVGDFDGALDSTRTGILYLSETVSKLKFQKPDKLSETIVASKVSGKDNGFSFNNAASVDFDFYENNLPFQANVISPLSTSAFNYYKFKWEASFQTESKQQINKIKIIPRRDTEPVVEGYIYIVEDTWALYGVDVVLKGYRMQTPAIDHLNLKQTFSYNPSDKIWTKNTQTLDFVAGLFGFNVSGIFTYVYSNFQFEPQFDKKTFTNEILSFEKEANKKNDDFWNGVRPVPLTLEEKTDYQKKDSLQTLRKSQKYLDSIDRKSNKFSLGKILSGYTYSNSFKNYSIFYESPLLKTSFNTVQGYAFSAKIGYTKRDPDFFTFKTLSGKLNYGLSEHIWRGKIDYVQKFSNTTNAQFVFSAGSDMLQFNEREPISAIVNTVSSLFFRNNFAKFYHKNFLKVSYGQEVVNGLFLSSGFEYSERKPLYNHTNFSIIKSDDLYSSNHPLLPLDESLAVIEKHNLLKFKLGAKINLGQQYMSRPDGKFNFPNDKYPSITLNYEKGLSANEKKYTYDFIAARIEKDFTLGNKGVFGANLQLGTFFNADAISFVDYKHFNGNQTHIGQSDRYLNTFNLMDYYQNSTNDSFVEWHSEYDDKGFIINKIPGLNLLKSNMILGFHQLSLPNKTPYQEVSIGLDNLGFGKMKIFRIDYVRSYQSGYKGDGVVFGLKILNAFN